MSFCSTRGIRGHSLLELLIQHLFPIFSGIHLNIFISRNFNLNVLLEAPLEWHLNIAFLDILRPFHACMLGCKVVLHCLLCSNRMMTFCTYYSFLDRYAIDGAAQY